MPLPIMDPTTSAVNAASPRAVFGRADGVAFVGARVSDIVTSGFDVRRAGVIDDVRSDPRTTEESLVTCPAP
jgi:hypothetical protein